MDSGLVKLVTMIILPKGADNTVIKSSRTISRVRCTTTTYTYT